MNIRPVDSKTIALQALASDPTLSAWVSANAGSGKTHVLAQRVVRLLLEGVPPSRILCLTFTKAAAANMSMRVFRMLADWTRLDDEALAQAIASTGAQKPDARKLVVARRLFAQAVETPGGLKIETLHAFCERLLHLFPFEAKVPAGFAVIEDAEKAEMIAAARETILAQAIHAGESPLGVALSAIAEETKEDGFEKIIAEALGKSAVLRKTSLPDYSAALKRALGLSAVETVATIEAEILDDGIATSDWADIVVRLNASGGAQVAVRLSRAIALADAEAKRAAYLQVFLTGKLVPRALSYLSKNIRKNEPALCQELDDERDRIARVMERLRAARAHARSIALVTLAQAILAEYFRLKSSRGRLDFDDLLEGAQALLTDVGAQWVLYKLDAGIDHILVDEAQDISPLQWSILQAIVEDFMSGRSANERLRSFFAVGDEKQSIYSFQGADPSMFAAMRGFFASKTEAAERRFAQVGLTLSFRSAPGVLEFVDSVFSTEENFTGLSADPLKTVHTAWKNELPALVELWPPVGPQPAADPSDWKLPIDVLHEGAPALVLARRIASLVKTWLAPTSPERVHDDQRGGLRGIEPRDVMILVRKRDAFFDAVIGALKEKSVPVAGADRLVLNEHIAVMDLVAAGRASLLPQDDLTLATLLKSPLVGLTDDDLIALAPNRKGSLANALAQSSAAEHQAAQRALAHWRSAAQALTPFFFFSDILSAGGGRARLLARLGPEANDAIDEFLALALAHEDMEAPSLLNFIESVAAADIAIKRDMETGADAVRVMTVHGAKGLESKIVFLPDTCSAPTGRHDPKLFDIGGEQHPMLVWSPRVADDPGPVAERRATLRKSADDEYARLLYVALTRAEERLYISGFHGVQARTKGCWYDRVASAFGGDGFGEVPAPWAAGETVTRRIWPGSAGTATASAAMPGAPLVLPDWIKRAAPAELVPLPPLNPSTALASADRFATLPDEANAEGSPGEAAAAGRLVHALLQYLPGLPSEARSAAAARFAGVRAGSIAAARRDELVAAALAVLERADLAPLFGPASRAEVPLAARLQKRDGSSVEIAGQIDRLAATHEEIFIADYKSGTVHDASAIPAAYATQLALYRAAVAPLFPGLRPRALIIFTAGPTVVEIDPARLDAALARVLGES